VAHRAGRASSPAPTSSLSGDVDNGKSVVVARAVDVTWAAEIFLYYADLGHQDRRPHPGVGAVGAVAGSIARFRPVGVVRSRSSREPLVMAAFKVAPARVRQHLILSPSDTAPRCCSPRSSPTPACRTDRQRAPGFGDIGAALSRIRRRQGRVPGSTDVGRKSSTPSGSLKKVSLELGGKSPRVVFADADLDAAIPGAASGFLFNHGQTCTAGTRLLVEDRIFDEFTQGVAELARARRSARGWTRPTTSRWSPANGGERSPDTRRRHRRRCPRDGGRRGDTGFYVEPSRWSTCARRLREEIFGPVTSPSVQPRARCRPRLLGKPTTLLRAGRQRVDPRRRRRTGPRRSRQAQCGSIAITLDTALPFGGYKTAGAGSARAIAEYTQTKAVNMAL
jgi:acyl-CoA reductase-like NAD-dependent aldehyde dehydrogenase